MFSSTVPLDFIDFFFLSALGLIYQTGYELNYSQEHLPKKYSIYALAEMFDILRFALESVLAHIERESLTYRSSEPQGVNFLLFFFLFSNCSHYFDLVSCDFFCCEILSKNNETVSQNNETVCQNDEILSQRYEIPSPHEETLGDAK